MKKIILLVAFVTSFYGVSQTTSGFRAAYNISDLDFEDSNVIEHKYRNSVAIGFFVEFDLSENIALMPELQFSGEGSRGSLRVDYLQLPVFLKFRLNDKFAISAGPQFGIKTLRALEGDGLESFAFSGIAGIEYMISDNFFIDLRYSYGFTDVFESDLLEAKNRNIQIGLGYKI